LTAHQNTSGKRISDVKKTNIFTWFETETHTIHQKTAEQKDGHNFMCHYGLKLTSALNIHKNKKKLILF